MNRFVTFFVLFGGLSLPLCAEPPRPAADPEGRGWTFNEAFQGNHDGSTTLLKLDSAIGYRFGALSAEVGLPVYLQRGTPAGSTTTTSGIVSGIGNAYVNLGLGHGFSSFDYSSSLTVSAP